MQISVTAACVSECGVRVRGQIDPDSREFIHEFVVPPGADALLAGSQTEIASSRLATFSPDAVEWRIECPLCRKSIRVGGPGAQPVSG